MSFLRVNGWELPVNEFKREPKEIGDRQRAFDGTPHVARRALKGSWSGNTTRQLPSIATAIEGAVLGRGESWTYNSDLWSQGGVGVSGSTAGNIRSGTGSVGGEYIGIDTGIGTFARDVKYGSGALAVEPVRTNILPADSRDAENAPTGYSAHGGASIAVSTARAVQGSKCIKATTTGSTGQGVETNTAPVSGSTTYTGSVYVLVGSTAELRLTLIQDVGGSVSADLNFDGELIGVWVRMVCSITTDPSATTVKLVVETNDDLTIDIYCDAWQLEAGSYATTWVDGVRTTGNDLAYPASLVTRSRDLTINAWVRAPSTGLSSASFVMRAAGSTDSIYLYREASTNNLVFGVGASGSSDSVSISTAWDGLWHHIVAVIRSRSDAGASQIAIYKDGALVQSKTPSVFPDLTSMTSLTVGNYAGSSNWYGMIDDLVIVPYAMCADQIAALYAIGQSMSPLPRVYVDGDFASYPLLTQLAVGSVESAPYKDGSISGTYYTGLREVEFKLDEM